MDIFGLLTIRKFDYVVRCMRALHMRRITSVLDNDPKDEIVEQLFPSFSSLSSAYRVSPALAVRCVTSLGQLCSMTFCLVAFLLNLTHDGSC